MKTIWFLLLLSLFALVSCTSESIETEQKNEVSSVEISSEELQADAQELVVQQNIEEVETEQKIIEENVQEVTTTTKRTKPSRTQTHAS